jgi:hypothetical protein
MCFECGLFSWNDLPPTTKVDRITFGKKYPP